MNSVLLNSKKKIINNLDEILLDLDKNIRNSGHNLQWLNSEVKNASLRKKEKNVFYIIEGNLIIYFNETFENFEKSIVITPKNILNSINDYYEICLFNEYPTNFQIINLNTIKTKITIFFAIENRDLKILKDIKLRKLFYCINCSLCSSVCPINKIIPDFTPINDINRQIDEKGSVTERLCTNCKACEQICPVNIKMSEFILNLNFKKEKSITERALLLFNKNQKNHIKTNKYINNRLKL